MEQQTYEFGPEQNETIRILASRMKFVGIFYIVIGVLMGIAGLVALAMMPLFGAVYLLMTIPQVLIGIWTTRAATSFRMIVESAGSDIQHLSNALDSLRKLYTLQFWILIVVIAFFVLGLLFSIIGGVMMGSM